MTNGDFELGHVAWVELTDFPYDLIRTTFPGSLRPHSGVWATWLGGVYGGDEDASEAIIQRITVSPNKPYLSYWHWVVSAEACGGFDSAGVGVDYGAPDPDVVDVIDLCSRSNTDGWKKRTIDMRKYAGQTVIVIFLAITDSSLNSNWFLDDVAFQSRAAVAEERTPPSADRANAEPHAGVPARAPAAQRSELSDLVQRLRDKLTP